VKEQAAMHLLQVCNVGHICGGTAACAWTLTRALPHVAHTVAFLSNPTESTRHAFAHCRVETWPRVTEDHLAPLRPDVLLLHNISADRVQPIRSTVTIQYLHSVIRPAAADVTVACSDWLREQYPPGTVASVLHQAVPQPPPPRNPGGDTRALRTRLVVGRLCTPIQRKWPAELVPFYARLAPRHPTVDWEFVGCPEPLQPRLQDACQGRGVFHPAGWTARSHLWRWDALLYHHPTLTESFGRTAAESLRAGCIPVTDARGGFREQVKPDTGFLCNDADTFDRALAALHDPAHRRAMSRAAQADDRFSLRRFGSDLLQLLRSI
jgi:glycosyltransferase involved in cell wall biosynthesis